MDQFKKIVLVGLPGSGKSTFGRELAFSLNASYLDLDQLIENKYRMKISQIFSQLGEKKFREWETETLRDVLKSEESFVLASGGGCPCFNTNMDDINRAATSVYLNVEIDEIAERLSISKSNNRPMFSSLDQLGIKNKLGELLKQRKEYYDRSKLTLRSSEISIKQLIKDLTNLKS
jgi:shikimate kinase